jgi:N-acetylmuramoyl-L-alanine amidase
VNTEHKVVIGQNRWLACVLSAALLLGCLPALANGNTNNSASSRDDAEAQFVRAQSQRAELEATPESHRALIQYEDLVKSFRRVYLLSSNAKDVPLAILTVGDLNRKMGDLFDPKYYQSAIDAYQYLRHEYPTSRYREDALFAIAQIQKDSLRDDYRAQITFEQFLQLYPRSIHAAEAHTALTQISTSIKSSMGIAVPSAAATAPTSAPVSPSKQSAARKPARNATPVHDAEPPAQLISNQALTQVMEAPIPGRIAELHDIKTWTTPDYTRIVISLDGPVKYQAARVGNPERIYFDLKQARLSRTVASSSAQVSGDLLKGIRAGQNKDSTVRVVLEVGHIKDYSVFLLRDPYRMVVDVYAPPDPFASTITAKNTATAHNPVPQDASKKNVNPKDISPKTPAATAQKEVAVATAPSQTSQTSQSSQTSQRHESAQEEAADKALAADIANRNSNSKPSGPSNTTASSAAIPSGSYGYGPTPKDLKPAPGPSKTNYLKAGHNTGAKLTPLPMPSRPRDGQQSLSRALGLKVGRIVIDAGHGGHDTGTVGPSGLMEKDLCLDVALRLGKMIEEGLPGAEVVYTRSDDTFIPLEERTNIANQAKADLFISIHANSSPDSSARGVETYYLNFSPSPEAMDVAARENATAQNSVHDLESIIQRIARNEKIEESRELAADIQDSLARRLQRVNKNIRNRGVRKAPFVVLIGANMPSVLAEISFISNPADEVSLAKPDGRDRVAEGLYKGIEAYLQSTNSLAANQTKPIPNGRTSALAQSGNQR